MIPGSSENRTFKPSVLSCVVAAAMCLEWDKHKSGVRGRNQHLVEAVPTKQEGVSVLFVTSQRANFFFRTSCYGAQFLKKGNKQDRVDLALLLFKGVSINTLMAVRSNTGHNAPFFKITFKLQYFLPLAFTRSRIHPTNFNCVYFVQFTTR